jgi:hypothetical protein
VSAASANTTGSLATVTASGAERGEISLEAAAEIVGVCNMTALRMLRRGDMKGRQICPGAPWVIKTADLAGFTGAKRSRPPLTPNPAQWVLDLQ